MPPMSISIVSVNEHRNLRQAFKVLRINQRVHSQWPQSTAEIQNAVFLKLFEYTTIPCPMHFRNESRLCMRPGMWIWGRVCEYEAGYVNMRPHLWMSPYTFHFPFKMTPPHTARKSPSNENSLALKYWRPHFKVWFDDNSARDHSATVPRFNWT